jgi:hypothetical protein
MSLPFLLAELRTRRREARLHDVDLTRERKVDN